MPESKVLISQKIFDRAEGTVKQHFEVEETQSDTPLPMEILTQKLQGEAGAIILLTWTLLLTPARRVVEADLYLRSAKGKGWGLMEFLGYDGPHGCEKPGCRPYRGATSKLGQPGSASVIVQKFLRRERDGEGQTWQDEFGRGETRMGRNSHSEGWRARGGFCHQGCG